MSTLKVDPDALRATKPGITDVAQKVIDVVKNVQSVVEAEGECWGGDEIGQNFAKDYTPGAEEGLQSIESLSKAVDALGGGVDSIASAFQDQDDLNAKALKKVENAVQ
ncbi:WXG100 family type VII secretion target [Nocardia sp. NPDC050710]|uniref:WXG100 family type VII secretion target n=1 Tax=Nocardia sp. NPDC050710 TaxID=3157220 RepID=UPI003411529A